MRKIKYFALPLVVCFVIALSPCCFVSAEEDSSSFDLIENSDYWVEDSILDFPSTFSMRTMLLDADSTSVSDNYNYLVNTSDICGFGGFDNHFTHLGNFTPLTTFESQGLVGLGGLKWRNIYSSLDSVPSSIRPYVNPSLIRRGDEYIDTATEPDYFFHYFYFFFHFPNVNLNYNYIIDFTVLVFDDGSTSDDFRCSLIYDSNGISEDDYSNNLMLYSDYEEFLFSPAEFTRISKFLIKAHYRFSVSGDILNKAIRLGLYNKVSKDYSYSYISLYKDTFFTIREFTEADKLYEYGADNKIDNTDINNNLYDSKNAYQEIVDNNQVSKTELSGVLSEASNLLHLPLYASAVSQISSWITNLVSSNYLIYSLIITALSISLCLYVLGRGF